LGIAASRYEQLFLLGLFGASIGFPFFALAANGTVLQAWFALWSGTGRKSYFSLRGQQRWKPFGIICISTRTGTIVDAGLPGQRLAFRLLSADRVNRIMRRLGCSFADKTGPPGRACSRQSLPPAIGRMTYWVALAFRAVSAHDRGDRAHNDRRCRRAVSWVLPLSLT